MKALLSWIREQVDVPGTAEGIGPRVMLDKPIASAVLRIGAVDEALVGQSGGSEVIALQFEREHHIGLVPIAERVAAAFADDVLEVDDVAAVIAAK